MSKQFDEAAALQLENAGEEIAAILLQSLLSKAEREGSHIEPADFIGAAAVLLESAWGLAKIAGPEHREGYARIVRTHADSIEEETF